MMSNPKRPKLACSLCTRRKVKCDKNYPCQNCVKTDAECVPHDPQTLSVPRKRAADEELNARLARYEALMRQHNIDFSKVANVWMSSATSPRSEQGILHVPVQEAKATAVPDTTASSTESHARRGSLRWCTWSDLNMELKYPSTKRLRHQDDPFLHSIKEPFSSHGNTNSPLHSLHPEPRRIYQFWQIFVEKVNPLTKIIHVPTLQQRVMEASWDTSNTSKSLTAIMFAVYTLAVTSTSTQDCLSSFGETRPTLLSRYREATLQALVAANFLTTRGLEVLQALVLFLLADPDSDITSSLCAVAVRIGHKMGLNRNQDNNMNISFFEKEMRIRLWWRIGGLEGRCRAHFVQKQKPLPPPDFGDIRIPLNVNDADLHPDMKEPPLEHTTPTEMRCVLLKYELANGLRSSPNTAKVFENLMQDRERSQRTMDQADQVIDDTEALYHEKYLRHSDTNIPLHRLTHAVATLAIAGWRFMVRHPRMLAAATAGNGEVFLTREENDALFSQAVLLMEMMHVATHDIFPAYLVNHLFSNLEVDVLVFVLSELRQRLSGERVAAAWRLVEGVFTEHAQIIDETSNTFYVALGDLALSAWDAQGRDAPHPPAFVRALREKRTHDTLSGVDASLASDFSLPWATHPWESNAWDGEFWGEFLQP